jgi:hypothetical protein
MFIYNLYNKIKLVVPSVWDNDVIVGGPLRCSCVFKGGHTQLLQHHYDYT